MPKTLEQLSALARKSAQSGDWPTVRACAERLLARDASSAEGRFLLGLAEKAAGRPAQAAAAFAAAIGLDQARYDAGVELAALYASSQRAAEALELLRRYEPRLGNSPRYLHAAAAAYSRLELHERAWPLYRRAHALQPEIEPFQADLAACSVFLGRLDEARGLYRALLERNPRHQRNHYQLARLVTAEDDRHVEQMKAVLAETNLPPARNVFLYYAIGKELEDLERWDEAFEWYRRAGDAAASVADYDVAADVELIEAVIETCGQNFLTRGHAPVMGDATPVFVVGLPRTGTTLTERILSSHPQVGSAGETLFLQTAVRRAGGLAGGEPTTPAAIEAAARADPARIAADYLEAVRYRLGPEPFFIDKFPENFLYLGFIARAFPNARLVHVRRGAMDTCFAMYKQSFFRYAYRLDDLARYYIAYDSLARHWHGLLGSRLVEVRYESLVTEPEAQVRALLERLGLAFEPACLEFDHNPAASATPSAVQVRERIHTRSIGKWRRFERHLQGLRDKLADAKIALSAPGADTD